MDDLLEVTRLVFLPRGMELTYKEREALEAHVVVLHEEIMEAPRRVRGVDAIHEAPAICFPQVVLGSVTHQARVAHRATERFHLTKTGSDGNDLACPAHTEREGCREVGCRAGHASLLLRIQHCVEGTNQGPAEMRRHIKREELQVRLVHEDHSPQCWVIDFAAGEQEARFQHGSVLLPNLRVAVEVGADTTAPHLGVGVVAEPGNDIQSKSPCLI
mmetsp:Transcript_113369/g.241931  ORF Transcript_113369/g.241931 Transcript_113369/m.241931 type:complete len:216 (+) Transcript_113369:702-1349(+)